MQGDWQHLHGISNDMARMVTTMQAVEQACAALQVPTSRAAAETALLTFRKAPQPIQACQYILENSQMPMARFQAAATMQEAAIREWALLSAEQRNSLRTYCLRYVVARADAAEAYVQVKVLAVAAVLLKRGWLDFATDKEAFFGEVYLQIVAFHIPKH